MGRYQDVVDAVNAIGELQEALRDVKSVVRRKRWSHLSPWDVKNIEEKAATAVRLVRAAAKPHVKGFEND